MLKASKITIVAMILAGAGAGSYAAKSADNDSTAIGQARISLAQATTTAEQHAGGRAVRAEFEKARGGTPVFDIEVVNGADTFDVRIDADKGTVISSARDKRDHDDHNDSDD